MGRTNELLNPLCEAVALLSVADALVVVKKSTKADGAKGSNGLVIKSFTTKLRDDEII